MDENKAPPDKRLTHEDLKEIWLEHVNTQNSISKTRALVDELAEYSGQPREEEMSRRRRRVAAELEQATLVQRRLTIELAVVQKLDYLLLMRAKKLRERGDGN